MSHPDFHRAPGASDRNESETVGGRGEGCGHRRCGPPWPLAVAAIGGAFWLFPPLGIASLAYVALRRRHGRGEAFDGRCGPGFGGRRARWRGFGDRGFGRHGSGNAAFDEARAEAWAAMQAEAEAFDDFRRRERTARDREVYDRFRGEQAARPVTTSEPPRTVEPGAPAA